MWRIRAAFIVITGILLVFVPGLHADSLQLKNGNFVQGKYLGGTERAVQFQVNGKIRLYDTDEILSINFAAASADGGIPSSNAAPKPSANMEPDSAPAHKMANSEAKKRFSATPARSVRVLLPRFPVISG